jgi:hypothetical protein
VYFLSFADLWIRVPSREPLFFILPPALRLPLSLARPSFHEAAGFRQPFDASSLLCATSQVACIRSEKHHPPVISLRCTHRLPGSKSSLVDILPYFQVRGPPKSYMMPVDLSAFPSSIFRTCPTSVRHTQSEGDVSALTDDPRTATGTVDYCPALCNRLVTFEPTRFDMELGKSRQMACERGQFLHDQI